jgi:hypothetical protein
MDFNPFLPGFAGTGDADMLHFLLCGAFDTIIEISEIIFIPNIAGTAIAA